jgi:hypothetical protein
MNIKRVLLIFWSLCSLAILIIGWLVMKPDTESHMISILAILTLNFPSSLLSSFIMVPFIGISQNILVQWFISWFFFSVIGYFQWFILLPWLYHFFKGKKSKSRKK